MSQIYDPSDLGNNINGFNIVECCTYKPVEMYIMIPNLGYGFMAHVANTYADKIYKLTPGDVHSVSRTIYQEKQNAVESGSMPAERERFAPMGTGVRASYMVMKISLNSQCARKVQIDPPLRLPLPFKVRDTAGSDWITNFLTHHLLQEPQMNLVGMMTSIVSNETGPVTGQISSALASMHIRALADLRINKIPEAQPGTTPSTTPAEETWKFTGRLGVNDNRVEFTHMFKSVGQSLYNKDYADLIAQATPGVPWGECLLRPAVFVAFADSTGKQRLYYSPDHTQRLLSLIEIEGAANAPRLEFSKLTYAFGIDPAKRALMQPWLRYVSEEDEPAYIGQPGLEDIYTESLAMPKESVHNVEITSNLSDIKVLNRSTGVGEQTETVTLFTPGPPLFTRGEIYRDSFRRDHGGWYFPFSWAYILPLAMYARSAADTPEGCQFCGGTKYIGYTHCVVCGGGNGIRCPQCIDNVETMYSQESGSEVTVRVPGFLSQDCTTCNPGAWELFGAFSSVYPQEQGRIPCPECSPRALLRAMAAGWTDVVDVFRLTLGKAQDGTGTCPTCNGQKTLPCPECVANPNEELRSPTPGRSRLKCSLCNDKDNSSYKGKDTAKPGYLKCSSANLAFAAGDPKTRAFYEHLNEKQAPTCDDTGYVTKVDCPACDGGLQSYRFRSVDFAPSVDPMDDRCDNGTDYTLSPEDAARSQGNSEVEPVGTPFVTDFDMPDFEFSDQNVAVYAKLPFASWNTLKQQDPFWRDDSYGVTDEATTPYKWLPKYMYKIDGSRISIFRKLPAGTLFKFYGFPTHTLNGTDQTLGWKRLNASNPPALADTVFDGSSWCFVKDTSMVPIISGIRCVQVSDLYRYMYKHRDQMGTLSHQNYHREGFAHLANATKEFYALASNPVYEQIRQHVGTARCEYIPDPGSPSRWLYAPADPTRTLRGTTNDASWVKLQNFEDITEWEPAFRAANSSRQKTFDEWAHPAIDINTRALLKVSSSVSTEDNDSITEVLSHMSAYRDLRYCKAEDEFIFTHIAKGEATKIKGNMSSGGATAIAKAGIAITHPIVEIPLGDPDLPRQYRPFNPMLEISDVEMAPDGAISVSALFGSSIAMDDIMVCTAIKDLIEQIPTLATDVREFILVNLPSCRLDETSPSGGVITSPEPTFDYSSIVYLDERRKNELRDALSRMANVLTFRPSSGSTSGSSQSPAQYVDQFLGVMEVYVANPSVQRPENLAFLAKEAVSAYMEVAYQAAVAASRIFSAEYLDISGTWYMQPSIAAKVGDETIDIVCTEEAMVKGLWFYNLRKLNLLFISALSMVVSAAERAMVYIKALDRRYDPFPDFIANETRRLLIAGFITADNEYCFPKVQDIDLTSLSISSVKANHITAFTDDTNIKYDVKLKIPEFDVVECKPMPFLGFGIGQDGQSWFDPWSSKHKYPFEGDGLLARYAGETPDLTFPAALQLPDLTVYEPIQETLSMRDYAEYDGPGSIRYIDATTTPTPRTVGMSPKQFGEALEAGMKNECPKISRTEVEGIITMADIFPYLSAGVVLSVPPIEFPLSTVEFNISQPRGILGDISASYATPTGNPFVRKPIVDDGFGPLEGDSSDRKFNLPVLREEPEVIAASKKALSDAARGVKGYLTHPSIVSRLFEHALARGGNAGTYKNMLFVILGTDCNTLEYPSRHGDSALLAYLFNELGGKLRTELAPDGAPDDTKIAIDMKDSNAAATTKWMWHSNTHDNFGGGTVDQTRDRNFCLWLSKRRAYVSFMLLVAHIFNDYISNSRPWQTGRPYKVWDIVKNGGKKWKCLVDHTSTVTAPPADPGNWVEITLNTTVAEGTVIFRGEASYNLFTTPAQNRYRTELIYSELATGPAIPAGDVIKFQPFHAYGFGTLLNKEDISATEALRGKNQRLIEILTNQTPASSPARLWTLKYMGRVLQVPLGGDLVDTPCPVPSNNLCGGWPLPKVGTSANGAFNGHWMTLRKACDDTVHDDEYATDPLFNKLFPQICTGNIPSEAIGRARVICQGSGDGASIKQRINDRLNAFMATKEGMGAFSIPRDADSMTSRIWLVITKVTQS